MTRTPPNPNRPMTARPTYVVACLAGHGIGPEITAAASRALARLGARARLRRRGAPPAVRHRGADALRPSPPRRDAACDLERRRGARRGRRGARTRRPPRGARSRDTGDARARRRRRGNGVRSAARRTRPTGRSSGPSRPHARASGRLTSVGVTDALARLVDRHAERHPGVEVEHVSLPEALRRLAAGSAGVLVAEGVLGDAVAEAPAAGGQAPTRRLRAALADRARALRPVAGDGERPRGAGRRRPEPDAARDGRSCSRRARPRRGRRGARGQPHDGAPRTATAVGGRRDRGSPRRPASSSTPCSACCRAHAATRSSHWGSLDEDHGRRRDPALPRGRGRRGDVRDPRRGDHADLRRDGARHDRAARARPARAGRRAHGAGLRPRVGQASASRSRPRAPARRTSSPRSRTRGWTRRRSSASPARCGRT